jgi:hypothetical protein
MVGPQTGALVVGGRKLGRWPFAANSFLRFLPPGCVPECVPECVRAVVRTHVRKRVISVLSHHLSKGFPERGFRFAWHRQGPVFISF